MLNMRILLLITLVYLDLGAFGLLKDIVLIQLFKDQTFKRTWTIIKFKMNKS